MATVVPVLLLTILGIELALLFRRTLVETIPVSAFLIVFCLYIGGFFRNLTAGIILVVGLTTAMAFWCWKCNKLTQKEVSQHYRELARSAIVILPAMIIVFAQTWGMELTIQDGYAHWGVAVKDMYYNNQLYCSPDGMSLFKDYPPAISLIEYFFCFFGPFQSQNIARGLDMLQIVCLFPMFKNVVKHTGKYGHILCGWITAFILLFANYAAVLSQIMVDPAMAILLSYVLIAWFGDEQKDNFTLLAVVLSLMMLTLAKGSGIGLALLALLAIGADVLTCKKRSTKMKIIPIAGFLSVGLSWVSWRLCTALYGVSASRSQGAGIIQGILKILKGNIEEYQIEAILNFYDSFLHGRESALNSITYVQWFFILILCSILVGKWIKEKRQARLLVVAMPAMHIIYSILMLLTYILCFGPEEGRNLASMSRYMPSCFLGCLLFLLGYLLIAINDKENDEKSGIACEIKFWKNYLPLIITAIVAIVFPLDYLLYDLLPPGPATNANSRAMVAPYKQLRELSAIEDRDTLVYMIGNTENDGHMVYLLGEEDGTLYSTFEAMVSRYELIPLNSELYRLDQAKTKEQVEEDLLTCDYVFVLPQEEPFTEESLALIPDEIKNQGGILYKVDGDKKTFIQVDDLAQTE